MISDLWKMTAAYGEAVRWAGLMMALPGLFVWSCGGMLADEQREAKLYQLYPDKSHDEEA